MKNSNQFRTWVEIGWLFTEIVKSFTMLSYHYNTAKIGQCSLVLSILMISREKLLSKLEINYWSSKRLKIIWC